MNPPPIRAFQWDIARQIERFSWLMEQLPRYADWGYQELYLHLEDAVEFPSLPKIARSDAYSYRQMEKLVSKAEKLGIKTVPIINLLGHTQYIIKVPELRDLNECRHPDGRPQATGQICPLHPHTLGIAEKLIRDMQPFCTAGKVHVGLDESFKLGQHPLSRREIKRIGRAAHFARHVQRLHKLTKALDLEMGMWADMLYFLPEAIPLLPKGITAYDWYYYPFRKHPQVEFFNYIERDLATPLRKHGIKYWGCPMNGAFRYEPLPHFHDRLTNLKTWWRRCHDTQAEGMLITSWEPNRLAMETTTLVDAAAAQMWLKPGDIAHESMLAAGLERTFGTEKPKPVARALLATDEHAFTGYPRWEINKDWALASGGNGGIKPFRDTSRYVTKLKQRSARWPAVLRRSVDYRDYLARRDLWVRTAQSLVGQLRQRITTGKSPQTILAKLSTGCDQLAPILKEGLNAARDMWKFSRYLKPAGPNEAILAHDLAQLEQLRKWIRTVDKDKHSAFTASPVMGRWQCSYEVRNDQPGVLRIDLSQNIGARWSVIKSCYTIEFISTAARRRNGPSHIHSAPVEWNPAKGAVELKLSGHGTGIVKIANLTLTNGVATLRPLGRKLIQLGSHQPPDQWVIVDAKTEYRFSAG